jgi:molybdenum cofactor biosynthesis enzyme MoaA
MIPRSSHQKTEVLIMNYYSSKIEEKLRKAGFKPTTVQVQPLDPELAAKIKKDVTDYLQKIEKAHKDAGKGTIRFRSAA